MMNPLRIVLADDHTLLRAGIRALLHDMKDLIVVGEAGDGQEALRLVKQEKPDILLADISMPLLNGIELTTKLSKELPDVKVIILSGHTKEDFINQALTAGARGYVLKDAQQSELEIAIRSAAAGKVYLSPTISGKVVDDVFARRRAAQEGEVSPFASLTSRQREILQLIAEGNSNKEVAQKLDLSVKTVETHRTQIMSRLNIHDTAGLVRYAIRSGIVSSE